MPYETGGFLGGKDGVICGLLPTFNKDWDENTDVFAITDDDLVRAHAFFKKHDLSYYGVYHTHPKGVAYPSPADIATGQRYHFIISYKDKDNPVFNAFRVDNNQPQQLALKLVSNMGYSSISLDKNEAKIRRERDKKEEADLGGRIQNIREGKDNIYERQSPKEGMEGTSDFSTFA